jgi:hypothetical protein
MSLMNASNSEIFVMNADDSGLKQFTTGAYNKALR